MRGIAGIVNFDPAPIDPAQIDRIIRSMAICPTDRVTTWCEGAAAFGHLIKFHQAEDKFERQPLRSQDGNLVIVTDAMLENRIELARTFALPASAAATLPDSAFVLRAYERWGHNCPQHLEGRFAFAVWNIAQKRLFCAVDHFGRRPLYYMRRGPELAFASTLRGLLALPGVSHRIDEGVLADFLVYARTEPVDRTLYSDISSCPAACCIKGAKSGLAVSRYWEPDLNSRIRFKSDSDYVDAFRSEFERAVSACVRVEGAVGILISGGLDSASATAVAGCALEREGKRLQAIHQLSNGDPRRAIAREHDESRYVRLLEQRLPQVDFHYVSSPATNAISLSQWTEKFEETYAPIREPVLEKPLRLAASFGVSRLLTGLGGNAIVSMESEWTPYLTELALKARWLRMANEILGQRRVYGRSIKHIIRHQLFAPFLPRSGATNVKLGVIPFLNPDFVRRVALIERIQNAGLSPMRTEARSVSQMASHVLTNVRPQNVGVTGSVISRTAQHDSHTPFFDRRLNEFCLSVPVEAQICNGWDRLLLRRSMHGFLPDAIVWRTSRGFPLPGIWQSTLALRTALPVALEQMRGSSLVGEFLNLSRIERTLVPVGFLEQGGLDPFYFVSLFGTGWFLRWLQTYQS